MEWYASLCAWQGRWHQYRRHCHPFPLSQTPAPKWGWGCAHAVPGQCSAVGITAPTHGLAEKAIELHALQPWDYARSRHSMHPSYLPISMQMPLLTADR